MPSEEWPLSRTPGAHARRKIQDDMVTNLSACAAFTSDSARELTLELIAEYFPEPPSFRSHSNARAQIIEIVHFCAQMHEGLGALVEVVGSFEPTHPRIVQLRQLLDAWQVAPLFPDDDWAAFRTALGDVVLPELTELFRAATQGRGGRPPPHCKTAWQVFVHLAGLNAGADGLSPHMIFLDQASKLLPASVGQGLRMRNIRRIGELGLTTALNEVRVRRHEEPAAIGAASLMIQLEAHALDPGSYTLSHWYQWDSAGWHPERGVDQTISISAIEGAVEKVIYDMETNWPEPIETVTLEFILPWDLINLPVDWWHKESGSNRPTPLTMDYPVIVRSLERLRTRRWHRAWHVRWQRFKTSPESSLPYWSKPAGADYYTVLETDLKADPRYTILVLSEPPAADTGGRKELEAALRAGIPVIIWHRLDCTAADFRQRVRVMLANETLAQLPVLARELRGEALRLDEANRDNHVGRHLTMLWDDPERQPEVSRSSGAPEEAIR